MKDTDYSRIIEMTYMGGGFIPANSSATELSERCAIGEIVPFLEVTDRDIRFHRAYMGLLAYIWEFLPKRFKNVVPKEKFYIFVKGLRKDYDVVYTYEDGTQAIEWRSIAFGRMSQKRFEEYIREQLPWIYENVIGVFFHGEMYDNIIATIEGEWEKFLSKL